MSKALMVKMIKDTIAVGESRVPNHTKAMFFSQVLEIYPTHPQGVGAIIPKLLKVMKALGDGNVNDLLGCPQRYEEINLYLQFAFLRNKIDITSSIDGRKNTFGWLDNIDVWIDVLEVCVRDKTDMVTLTDALLEVWEDADVQ